MNHFVIICYKGFAGHECMCFLSAYSLSYDVSDSHFLITYLSLDQLLSRMVIKTLKDAPPSFPKRGNTLSIEILLLYAHDGLTSK